MVGMCWVVGMVLVYGFVGGVCISFGVWGLWLDWVVGVCLFGLLWGGVGWLVGGVGWFVCGFLGFGVVCEGCVVGVKL